MNPDPIVAFYSGGADDRGRTLEAILAWPDDRLERVHDYIQWVFPTAAPSAFNPFAPLVTRDTTRAFDAPEQRDRLRRALDRMLAFYGLVRHVDSAGNVTIRIDRPRFDERAANWLSPGNHNHLRLTRIMQSLDALGLRPEAEALQRCLLGEVYEGPGRSRITRQTYDFWSDALNGAST